MKKKFRVVLVEKLGGNTYVKMAKLLTYIFIVFSFILWYFLLFGSGGDTGGSGSITGGGGGGGIIIGVGATNGHGNPLEGRDYHHMERAGHIKSKY